MTAASLRPVVQRPYDVVVAALLVTLLCYAVFRVFMAFGPPVGHSFYLNGLWAEAFAQQFRAGELYPRWLFSVNEGAGSPVFYFYGPLPFWIQSLAASLLCPGCQSEGVMMAGPTLLLALSSISFYLWIRDHVRASVALFAAILYLFLPYHFLVDLWYRQAVGEFAAYASMPLVLLGLERASRAPRYLCLAAAGYALLLFSHLPSALLFSPLIVFFVLLRSRPQQWLPLIGIPVALGIALAAIYLVPALTTQEYINAAAWWDRDEGHFIARNWLWFDGRDAPDPAFAAKVLVLLAVPSLLGLALAAGLLVAGEEMRTRVVFLLVSLLYAWFLMTAPSAFLWSHVSFLAKVQFPWRVGIVVDLCTAALVALSLERASARPRLAAFTACVTVAAIAVLYAGNFGQMQRHLLNAKEKREQQEILATLADGDDAEEYRTTWSISASGDLPHTELNNVLAALPPVAIIDGPGTATEVVEESERLSVTVDAAAPVRLRFRRFYYPGWQLLRMPGGETVQMIASAQFGLIEAALPAGRHRLVLQRGAIAEERLGAAVSAAALLLCLLLLWAGRLPRWRATRRHG